MFRDANQGPRSGLSRYAYGYSDQKPTKGFWFLLGLIAVYVITALALSGCYETVGEADRRARLEEKQRDQDRRIFELEAQLAERR